MMTLRSTFGVTVIALSLAGCDGVEPESGLTREEAEALFNWAMVKSNAMSRVPDTVVVGCPGDGEWEVVATQARSERGDTVEHTTIYEIRPRACIIGGTARRFTVDGGSGLRVERVLTFVDDLTEFTGTVSGDLGWTLDQRQGVCAMDLVLEVEIGESEVGGVVRGVLCEHDVVLDGSLVLRLRFW